MTFDETVRNELTNDDGIEVERSDVAMRLLYSFVFMIVLSVLESLLFVIVIYQLVFTFVTQQTPSARVQRLANGVVAYFRQILRYVTHNDSLIPFPFSDFPEPLEEPRPAYASRDSETDRDVEETPLA